MPRQPILSVLGHVDSGKTTLLDRIRESEIVEGEAGGITQMIGSTEVPLETVKEVCGGLLDHLEVDITIPGLLFIDTPGHAAFSSLRKRGGSISDIAILVVDIEEGIQPQTEEAIRILKESETPFVVALNKIDKMHGWRSGEGSFLQCLNEQSDDVQEKLDERIYELMGELHEHGITADRFDRVDDFQKKVAMVPLSAKTGEGIPELLMVVAGVSQRYLSDKLEVEEGIGRGTVLEVSEEEGFGTTVDVIHYDGIIKKTDKLVYGTSDGVRTTDIRALMEPKPLKEIRVDKQFKQVDEVHSASGVKIAGKELEGIISGSPVRTASDEDLEDARKEVEEELQAVEFETQRHGVIAKADSLGSLEAIMRELGENDIPVQKAEVGAVNRKDVIEVRNEEPENRAIFAFNVGTTDQGREALKEEDVKMFQSQVVYEIIEGYEEWKQELTREQREKALSAVSRPAKIRVMEDHVFRSSDPAVVGVKVSSGVLNPGCTLMNQDGEPVGRVKSVQAENESLEKAVKGDEVAVSIANATVGRDFEEGETLYVSLTGKGYRQLQELEDLLSRDEMNVLDEIVDIKDSKDPHWKLG
ncbi:MAG: translation initiation factor IF-2 [Candidatus Nanohaloarchaea archaeon]